MASSSQNNVGPEPPIQKSFSCVLCSQRKVKCDKAPGGCSNCTKSRVSCVYKTPAPPRRRKKGLRELDTHTRLRIYEDALRKLGVDPVKLENDELAKVKARKWPPASDYTTNYIDVPPPPNSNKDTTESAADEKGVLLSGDGKSRYLENGLWTTLQDEFRNNQDLLDSSEEEENGEYSVATSPESFTPDTGSILFSTGRATPQLRSLHPEPLQIFKLWQIYLQNVNPLVKVFHAPTVQKIILEASEDLDDFPKNVEALMFAIYCISVGSLSEKECESTLGTKKPILLQRYRAGVQHALVNASFLKTTDLIVLEALTLFLLSLQDCDARVMWILTGIASRIGQRIGLHRDGGSLGLSPFDAEMRRRLWWQLIMLEGFAEKLAGSGGHVFTGDTRCPSNLNDSDLFPGMKELPKEHHGATEMMFFLIRCHLGERFRTMTAPKSAFDGVWNRLSTSETPLPEKQTVIDELEAFYQDRYIQYCDESVPWHYLCIHLAKNVIALMRFMALNPQPTSSTSPSSPSITPSQRTSLFATSLQITKWMNLVYKLPALRGYAWHVNLNFQWKSFIYLISELRVRPQDTLDVDEAWAEIQLTYDNHPSFARHLARKALPVAIGGLTLRSWEVFAQARGLGRAEEPGFIAFLRVRHAGRSDGGNGMVESAPQPTREEITASVPAGEVQAQLDWTAGFADTLDSMDGGQFAELPPFNPDEMNWDAWDSLLVDFNQSDGS
ncbi:hypothetical protein BU24DRAFT_348913 [Aaosphaeria arxii CBS 175.79]|uniref:Zn(2)-C6 fungal-type domain-containing protein n=1 Tax=Aaosphaeria arxii CBS 175.79 TaxID=1450172 RepID=A0A6A5XN32_9PLEO|nr:uncharacterized protein BU24DRAFT_348913 [Aaosphaeria arxii CBS 175.79]KAF2014532.1 hypothetical protein BU24DRAFT_348913 [Aaosphaeria arxii CBS 175.79]